MRIGAEFLSRWFPSEPKEIYLPTPTWGNHVPISVDSELKVKNYRYFDPKSNGLDFEGMKADLSVHNAIVKLERSSKTTVGRPRW